MTSRLRMTRRAAVCPVLFISEVSSSIDGFISAWILQTDLPLIGGLVSHHTRAGALLSALLAGVSSPPSSNTRPSHQGGYPPPQPHHLQLCGLSGTGPSTSSFFPSTFFSQLFPGPSQTPFHRVSMVFSPLGPLSPCTRFRRSS